MFSKELFHIIKRKYYNKELTPNAPNSKFSLVGYPEDYKLWINKSYLLVNSEWPYCYICIEDITANIVLRKENKV